MNAALTFQIGLNDSARAIRGKSTFAGAGEGFWGIWIICIRMNCTLQSQCVFELPKLHFSRHIAYSNEYHMKIAFQSSHCIFKYLHLPSIFPIKCVGGLGALMRA